MVSNMTLGILSILSFIIGILLVWYACDNENYLCIFIGVPMLIFGFTGIMIFIGVNAENIKQWFTV